MIVTAETLHIYLPFVRVWSCVLFVSGVLIDVNFGSSVYTYLNTSFPICMIKLGLMQYHCNIMELFSPNQSMTPWEHFTYVAKLPWPNSSNPNYPLYGHCHDHNSLLLKLPPFPLSKWFNVYSLSPLLFYSSAFFMPSSCQSMSDLARNPPQYSITPPRCPSLIYYMYQPTLQSSQSSHNKYRCPYWWLKSINYLIFPWEHYNVSLGSLIHTTLYITHPMLEYTNQTWFSKIE